MILLNSCTLETVVLLYKYKQTALYIHEGLRFSGIQEESWRMICANLDVPIQVSYVHHESWQNSPMIQTQSLMVYSPEVVKKVTGVEFPALRENVTVEDKDGTVFWYLPYRNPMLILMAMGAAEYLNEDLLLGFFDRRPPQKDYTPEALLSVIESAQNCSYYNKKRRVKVKMPFQKLTYDKILEIGLHLKVPFTQVWTCHNDLVQHCGVCVSCLHRRNIKNVFPHLPVAQPIYTSWE